MGQGIKSGGSGRSNRGNCHWATLIIDIQQANAQYYTEELSHGIGLDMMYIPGGSFCMGTPAQEIKRLTQTYDEELFREETPQHKVSIQRFFLGRYPITQAQWRVVALWEKVDRELEPDPSRFKEDYKGIDRWQRPVESVSWEDAVEFCSRLSNKTSKTYKLPTEAQWEYACRGGTNTPFHFGKTISTELANYDGNYTYGEGFEGEYRKQTTPVGYFKVANNFGLSEMHGNVCEWCQDDWHPHYKGAPEDGSAWLSGDSKLKVIRGGSWGDNPRNCCSAGRDYASQAYSLINIGFRIVRIVPQTT